MIHITHCTLFNIHNQGCKSMSSIGGMVISAYFGDLFDIGGMILRILEEMFCFSELGTPKLMLFLLIPSKFFLIMFFHTIAEKY